MHRTSPDRSRLILATDLDGTLLGGSAGQRAELHDWLTANDERVTLVFVTGRDLPFVREQVAAGHLPRPDYVIGDVGTTIAGGPTIEPIAELEADIARRWGNAGGRVRALLADAPGLRPQETPFRYRQSYWYEPEQLRPDTLERIESAGFDWLLSADTFLDVLPRGISKGPTLRHLARHFGWPDEHLLTAGDTLNDLSLFETGLAGVAVGNAEAALLERIAGMPHVHHSRLPGAAGILDAIHHHGFG